MGGFFRERLDKKCDDTDMCWREWGGDFNIG